MLHVTAVKAINSYTEDYVFRVWQIFHCQFHFAIGDSVYSVRVALNKLITYAYLPFTQSDAHAITSIVR